uniref:Amidohydro-rel domain-containing protein n=1 Tax=Ascaris lumbricoides TaxID=6252 RepID=A0A0M3IKN7_ASCLU
LNFPKNEPHHRYYRENIINTPPLIIGGDADLSQQYYSNSREHLILIDNVPLCNNVMDVRGKTLTAALIWTGNTFEKAIQIRVDSDGTIVDIGKQILKQGEQLIDLGQKALVPGFVNAHSHAFHHHMRGRSHTGSATSDNFWKWRDEMYSLVENISRQQLYEYSLATFKEMLSAGITTVGEFHYVHHGMKKFDLDSAILDAARDAQIRIVLIAHSLRAVSLDDCIRLSEWARNNTKPLHIHIEEQPKEIVDCLEALHSSPSQLILDKITAVTCLTAVHCTFTPTTTMEVFAQRGINVCVCPLTEGYLGDGIPNIVDESQICLGTDCNNRICMLEEMRWLAYCQHMKNNSRQACGLDARKLLRIATENGARSLGLEHTVGRFEIGMQLDFVAFDLNSPRIASIHADELLDAIIFGAGNADIVTSAVSARVVYSR